MNLEEKLLNAKIHHYNSISFDTEAFEKRLFQKLSKNKDNCRSLTLRYKWNKTWIGILASIIVLVIIIGFAPTVRANALLSMEQISSKIFSLNYKHPINGYVVIGGKKLTTEQYRMLFAKATWTKNRYKVTMRSHVEVEIQHGKAVEFPNAKAALAEANVPAKIPTYLPPNVEKIRYYAYPGSFNIWYLYSNNRQIYMTVLSKSRGTEVLDNATHVKIGNGSATVSEKPTLYINTSNKIKVATTSIIDYTDSQGIQYRIAATGFTKSDVIKIMRSVNVH